jgi:CRISPR/Cas system-associated protein Cas10 (large subunit of type III CRISPR-Cas system)
MNNVDNEKTIKIERTCPHCGKRKEILLSDQEMENFLLYCSGEGLIQDMLPNVSAADRELLVGGMCKDCWNELFDI